jgi:integrase/recombinase XerD
VPLRKHSAGSLAVLCRASFASDEFGQLDVSTRSWRRRMLGGLPEEVLKLPFALMEAKHVRALRDELVGKPAAANLRLKALKALFAWATEARKADHNPTVEVKLRKYLQKGHHSWGDR